MLPAKVPLRRSRRQAATGRHKRKICPPQDRNNPGWDQGPPYADLSAKVSLVLLRLASMLLYPQTMRRCQCPELIPSNLACALAAAASVFPLHCTRVSGEMCRSEAHPSRQGHGSDDYHFPTEDGSTEKPETRSCIPSLKLFQVTIQADPRLLTCCLP